MTLTAPRDCWESRTRPGNSRMTSFRKIQCAHIPILILYESLQSLQPTRWVHHWMPTGFDCGTPKSKAFPSDAETIWSCPWYIESGTLHHPKPTIPTQPPQVLIAICLGVAQYQRPIIFLRMAYLPRQTPPKDWCFPFKRVATLRQGCYCWTPRASSKTCSTDVGEAVAMVHTVPSGRFSSTLWPLVGYQTRTTQQAFRNHRLTFGCFHRNDFTSHHPSLCFYSVIIPHVFVTGCSYIPNHSCL